MTNSLMPTKWTVHSNRLPNTVIAWHCLRQSFLCSHHHYVYSSTLYNVSVLVLKLPRNSYSFWFQFEIDIKRRKSLSLTSGGDFGRAFFFICKQKICCLVKFQRINWNVKRCCEMWMWRKWPEPCWFRDFVISISNVNFIVILVCRSFDFSSNCNKEWLISQTKQSFENQIYWGFRLWFSHITCSKLILLPVIFVRFSDVAFYHKIYVELQFHKHRIDISQKQ